MTTVLTRNSKNKNLETNENEDQELPELIGCSKSSTKVELCSSAVQNQQTTIKKDNLTLHLKELKMKKQSKPEISERINYKTL